MGKADIFLLSDRYVRQEGEVVLEWQGPVEGISYSRSYGLPQKSQQAPVTSTIPETVEPLDGTTGMSGTESSSGSRAVVLIVANTAVKGARLSAKPLLLQMSDNK